MFLSEFVDGNKVKFGRFFAASSSLLQMLRMKERERGRRLEKEDLISIKNKIKVTFFASSVSRSEEKPSIKWIQKPLSDDWPKTTPTIIIIIAQAVGTNRKITVISFLLFVEYLNTIFGFCI